MRYLAAVLLASFVSIFLSVPTQAAGVDSPGLLPAFPAEAFRPSRQDDQYLQALQGLWNLRGGGYFADMRASTPQFYSYADGGNLCWPDPVMTSLDFVQSPLAYYAQSADTGDTAFVETPRDMQFRAQTVLRLPSACGDAIERSAPVYTFDAAVASLRDYYSFSAERHVDWAERGKRLRPAAAAARNDEDLAAVFSELLDGLQDVHTSIGADSFTIGMDLATSTVRTHRLLRQAFAQQSEIGDFSDWLDAWNAKQNDAIYSLLAPSGRDRVYNDAILWGTLEGNVGYLAINRVDGLDSASALDDRALVARTLDRALGELRGTRALVLDISMNTGGSTDIIADIAARFADRRRLAYTRQMPGDTGGSPQSFYVEPAGKVRYAKPVYLLTSDLTVSAAEYFALYLRVLPQVTHIGQTTQGALSGGFARGLPNGWRLRISNHVTRDPRGDSHEVVGIRPEVPFDVFPENGFEEGHVEAIRKGVNLVVSGSGTVAAPAAGTVALVLLALLVSIAGLRQSRPGIS